MSSSVYFRFKSQKEPSRVVFDGTGISVFELKREIIALNHLGDGTDFELLISSDETNEGRFLLLCLTTRVFGADSNIEFDDDTSIIPRSTTVIAKRLPALKPGRGGAARYVTGKMPHNPKNSYRADSSVSKATSQGKSSDKAVTISDVSISQTEEQKIAAMFKMGAEQWAEQQQEMSNATPIHRAVTTKKSSNVPDRPLPPGYICYRCGEKGHWIQVCPTNDDPSFDGRPRVKRTTGIPRSFLKTIEKPTVSLNDGISEESKQPAGVMVNAEGDWVIAEPDKASWENYQAKAKASVAAREAAALGSKELQERGLECSIDKRLFVEPTKTPCCHSTYCHECIVNALLENDLRCPNCSAENILIDNLESDNETIFKVRSYEKEQAENKTQDASNSAMTEISFPKSDKRSNSPSSTDSKKDSLTRSEEMPNSPSPNSSLKDSLTASNLIATSKVKKRPAASELKSDRVPSGPSTLDSTLRSMLPSRQHTLPQPGSLSGAHLSQQPSFVDQSYTMDQGMNMMPFSNINGYGVFPMSIAPPMTMDPGMLNAMMMPGLPFMGAGNNSWINSWEAGAPQQLNSSPRTLLGEGTNGKYTQQHFHGSMVNDSMDPRSSIQGLRNFSNQQQTTFNGQTLNEEDSAYFRKPVNPHRHQGRRNVNRPTDYREI